MKSRSEKAELTMRDVMTSTPRAVSCHDSIARARTWMKEQGSSELPVLEGTWPVGVVYARSIEAAETHAVGAHTVGDVMTTAVYVTNVDAKVRDALQAMAEDEYDTALILDGERLVGVFDVRNAMRLLVTALPEPHLTPGRKAA